MTKEDLRDLLYQKASKEQDAFVEHLKTLPPEQIIDKSYEKVMRDDILMTFEDDYLSDKQIAELIKLDYPLSACYDEWMETDASHMEMLRDRTKRCKYTCFSFNCTSRRFSFCF